jgi:hypothetical protein
MEQVEMNNIYINIDVNNGSEKCTEKTLRKISSFKRGLLWRRFQHIIFLLYFLHYLGPM